VGGTVTSLRVCETLPRIGKLAGEWRSPECPGPSSTNRKCVLAKIAARNSSSIASTLHLSARVTAILKLAHALDCAPAELLADFTAAMMKWLFR
jgi:hypothetical protein